MINKKLTQSVKQRLKVSNHYTYGNTPSLITKGFEIGKYLTVYESC